MLPIMGVGALIFDEKERVLLNYRTEKCEFYPSCWAIPCGKVEEGETPIDAIVREVKEETSLDVEVVEEVYKRTNERRIPEVAYLCKIIRGTPVNMEPEKSNKMNYFALDQLPQNTGKVVLEIIKAYVESHKKQA